MTIDDDGEVTAYASQPLPRVETAPAWTPEAEERLRAETKLALSCHSKVAVVGGEDLAAALAEISRLNVLAKADHTLSQIQAGRVADQDKRIAELEARVEMSCLEPDPACGCHGCMARIERGGLVKAPEWVDRRIYELERALREARGG